MLGCHLIQSWSSTQGPISISSGEAEFYGVVKASSMALGYQALMDDLGYQLPVRVWTDSTATIGICGRRGLGKLRHVDTQCLWIQQRVRDETIELRKVRGDMNPADLFTKHLLGAEKIASLLSLFGCEHQEGRAETAPKLREGRGGGQPVLVAQSGLPRRGEDELVSHDGHRYPRVEFEGELVPEAFEHVHNILPHLHQDLAAWFPRATAVTELDDEDPMEDTRLEERGLARGMSATNV